MLGRVGFLNVFCCLILSLFFSSQLAAKTIVLINSYTTGYEWSDLCQQGFSEFVDPGNTIISYEMDTKRSTVGHSEILANSIWQSIVKNHPDIVVTMDDNALKFFGQRVVSELDIPLVFMGVNDNPRRYFINNKIPSLVSGVMERSLVEQNITFLSQLLSLKNKRLLLMMDNSATSKSFIETVFSNRPTLQVEGVMLDVLSVNRFSEWQNKIASLSVDGYVDGYDALIIGSYGRLYDEQNHPVDMKTITLWTNRNSSIPIFSFWANEIGKGKSIGGLVMTGYQHGREAAVIVNEILSTGTVPPIKFPKQGKFIFSQSELERWHIQLSENIKKRSELID